MNAIGINFARLHDIFCFGDGDLCRRCHDRIKVPGCFGIAKVALDISGMSMNEGKIWFQRIFQDVSSAVEYPRFLGCAVGNDAC